MVAALCIPAGLVVAQPAPPPHFLPAGTRLDFVADDTISVDTVRPGGRFRVHLARDLILDGAPLAAAGTPARLIVTDKERGTDGKPSAHFALVEFNLRQGELPVVPLDPVLAAVSPGTVIAAQTAGSVEHTGGRTVISVPPPVPLSSDAPHAFFRAAPPKVPVPLLPRPKRGATPTPLPTTFNPPEPSPDASSEPAPSAAPSAAPSPAPSATMG
jgi:hypothetical protein